MTKIYIPKPVIYEYRVYKRPRSSLEQKSFSKILNREQEKRIRLI